MKKKIIYIFSFTLIIFMFVNTFVIAESTYICLEDGESSKSDSSNKNTNKDKSIQTKHNKAILIPDTGGDIATGKPGEKITMELPLAVNREYLPSTKYVLRNITIEPIIPTEKSDLELWPFKIENTSYIKKLKNMTYGSVADVFYDFKISETANKGVYPITFLINVTVWRLDEINGTTITEDVGFEIVSYVNVLDDGRESQKTNELGALSIATVDKDGAIIPAPSGNAGERIKLRLPILNNGGNLTNINITPVISTSLDEWPFVVEAINYGKKLPDMKSQEIAFIEYDFKISPNVTEGAKPINFRATYKENDVYAESLFSAYVNVEKGKPEEKELPESIPKLMIISYSINPKEIYAGDTFKLTLRFQNTSNNSTIKNAGINLKLEPENIMLAKGQSDGAYIDELSPKATASRTFKLKALSTAKKRTSAIVFTMNYENEKVAKGEATQAVVVPIKQKMKVFIEEPTIYYEDTNIDDPIAVNIPIINKGKSKVYNLGIDIEGEEVSMIEKYYGGDLLPAAKSSADFEVISGKSGGVSGNFVVTYENEEGQAFEQKVPFEFEINDKITAKKKIVQNKIKQPKKKISLPWIGGIAALILIPLRIVLKKKLGK